MTRGTHQVGAFATGLGVLVALGSGTLNLTALKVDLGLLNIPMTAPPADLTSLIGFFIGALLGGTAPDLDKPRRVWARALAHTTFGGHRHLSHSLIGLFLASIVVGLALGRMGPAIGVSPTLPFLGFVGGYASHLILDSLTIEGVPWFFPFQTYLGFPPWSKLRVKTGSLIEQLLVMPALLALIGWIGYRYGGILLRWWG